MLVFGPLLVALTALAPLVAGHGYVRNIAVNGQSISTWHPFDDPYASPPPSKPTRHFDSDGPVQDVKSKAITCGSNGDSDPSDVPVKTVAKGFSAGDKVTFQWTSWPGDHKGPVMTYLADCKGDCTTFDGSTGDVWFKIDEKGLDNGKWASDELIAAGNVWTVTIPSSIAAGQYLLRHEILALHGASSPGGAQFYPSCNQIEIASSGTEKPKGVALPGAYSAQDPGILFNVWGDSTTYKIPGPPVFGSTDESPSASNSSQPSASSPTPATSSSPAPSPSSSSPASLPDIYPDPDDLPDDSNVIPLSNDGPDHKDDDPAAKQIPHGRCSRRLARRRAGHMASSAGRRARRSSHELPRRRHHQKRASSQPTL